jgi:hypothetical protein
MKQLRLAKGTVLYHGTDCDGDFGIPDGPCWFAFDRRTAKNWVDWSQKPPAGRVKGPGRVIEVELSKDVLLLDVVVLEDWAALAMEHCGDIEASPYPVADSLAGKGVLGWIGEREIMLTRPENVLIAKASYPMASVLKQLVSEEPVGPAF